MGLGLVTSWLAGLWLLLSVAPGPVSPSQPLPCCTVEYMEPGLIPNPELLSAVHLSRPGTCEKGNVCKGYFAPDGVERTTALKEVCLNGYNIMAFLIAALQQLGGEATEAEAALLVSLINKQREYSIHRVSSLGK